MGGSLSINPQRGEAFLYFPRSELSIRVIVNVKGVDVCVSTVTGKDRFWKDDKIDIHDPTGIVDVPKIRDIVQYLYEEGFILDRCTKWELLSTKSK